ncbi:MAG: tetratricopeptide repeat protein [Candidatus Firestonebacteria bacterium]|nr:tetratricopeptide repeat protein [Candidatus Firestonebacteria bacterium]
MRNNKFYLSIITIFILFIFGCSSINSTKVQGELSSAPTPRAASAIIISPINKHKSSMEANEKTLINEKIKLIKEKKFIDFEKEIKLLLADLNKNSVIIDYIYSSLASAPYILPYLNEWCENNPDSYIAFTARGYFYVNYAWETRGDQAGNNINAKDWDLNCERLKLAKSDLEKAYDLNPNDPHASGELILVARDLNLKLEDMEKYFQNAIKSDPFNIHAHEKKLSYISPKWRGKSYKQLFEFVLETNKKIPGENILSLKLLILAQNQMLDLAAIDKTIYDNTYLQQSEIWDELKKIYEKWIKTYPKNMNIYLHYMNLATLSHKYNIALKQFEIVKNNFNSDAILFEEYLVNKNCFAAKNYGYILYKQSKYNDAIDYLEKISNIVKDNPSIYKILSYSYAKSGKEQKAIEYAKKILIVNTGDRIERSTYQECGTLLYELKKYKEAIDCFTEAITEYKDDYYSYEYLAFSYNKVGDKNNTILYAKKILAVRKDGNRINKRSYQECGYTLYKLKKYNEAIECLEEAVDEYKDDAYSYKLLAFCFDEIGNYEKTVEYAEKSIAANYYQPELRIWIKKKQGNFLSNNGQYREAIDWFGEMIKNNEEEEYAYKAIAECFKKMNNKNVNIKTKYK